MTPSQFLRRALGEAAFDLDVFRAGDNARRDVLQEIRDRAMLADADPFGVGQAISVLMNEYLG